MGLLEQLRERASAKEFDGRPIPEETLAQILEATSYSPRAGNFQHFSIRVLADERDITRAAQIFFNCETTARASALLVFFVDQNSTARFFEAEHIDYPFANLLGYHYALADTIIAMQTAALMAESLGLASRIMAASLQRSKAVAQAFSAPEGMLPVFTLALGYEAKPAAPKRHNLDWRTYTARGFSAPWPEWKTIYLESGKAKADAQSLHAMESVANRIQSEAHAQSTSAAEIWGKMKYRPEDLAQFSRELRDLLAKIIA